MNLSWRLEQMASRLRAVWWAGTGVSIGAGVSLGAGVKLRRRMARGGRGSITLGEHCELGEGVVVDTWGGTVTLAREVFLGPFVVIYGHGGVSIGERTLVAMHSRILSSNHAVPPFGTDIRSQPDVLLTTAIGRDVWLGAGVTVLGGVNIGDGCVVGAGAVVTKSLPPGAIAMGVPALVKGFRAGAPNAS